MICFYSFLSWKDISGHAKLHAFEVVEWKEEHLKKNTAFMSLRTNMVQKRPPLGTGQHDLLSLEV